MRATLLSLSALALSGCASLGALHGDYQCGHSGDASWRNTRPPPDADTYRALARAALERQAPRGREFWFSRADGAVKYCIMPTWPGRTACDGPNGIAWTFEQTENGLQTSAPDERVCVL
ncbi:MAG: hypothetical protein K2X34_05195 [Hyphomonadaceae bacterium]|nr:hypothetical protein [Hyphomonadaceae bacterium]